MPETVERFSREMLEEVVAEAVAKALSDRQILPHDHPHGKIGPHIAGYIDLADLIAKVDVERAITVDREMKSAD